MGVVSPNVASGGVGAGKKLWETELGVLAGPGRQSLGGAK